jgi:hypothetical protein
MSQIVEFKNRDDIIQHLKDSKHYRDFKSVLNDKIDKEARASSILEENIGNIRYEHMESIFDLIDGNYYAHLGYNNGPWFGRLIHSNRKNIFNETETKINTWVNLLTDENYDTSERIDRSLKTDYHIKGTGIGLTTLIFYLLDKSEYLIWFESLHRGLATVCPELIDFDNKGAVYDRFNDIGKNFARTYDFSHTEMDWILWKIGKAYRIV